MEAVNPKTSKNSSCLCTYPHFLRPFYSQLPFHPTIPPTAADMSSPATSSETAEEVALKTHEQALQTLLRAKLVVGELRATIEGFPTKVIADGLTDSRSQKDLKTDEIDRFVDMLERLMPECPSRVIHLRILFDRVATNFSGYISKKAFLAALDEDPHMQTLIHRWQTKHGMTVKPAVDPTTGTNIFDRIVASGGGGAGDSAARGGDKINFHEFLFFFMEQEVSAGALEGLDLNEQELDFLVAKGHWSYSGYNGPNHWHEISAKNYLAASGAKQSPINIMAFEAVSSQRRGTCDWYPSFEGLTEGFIFHTGHTVQVNWPGGSFKADSMRQFECKQFHFHSPSEHTVDGIRFPMEVQFVCVNKETGQVAVASVFFKLGKESPFLQQFWEHMPMKQDMTKRSVGELGVSELAEFFDPQAPIFRYMGSLTTPPCSERVMWTIGQRVKQFSMAQLAKFQKAMGGTQNFRPTQPLNGRRVLSNI